MNNYQRRAQRMLGYAFLLLSGFLLLQSCAQQIAPTGGKRDIISPKLLESTPENKQTNVKGQSVELLFDEYIVIENLNQKLLITPDPGEYDFKVRPTGLRIIFKKQLDSAKTYSLTFGDAVKDFSEKNPAKNLRLVFSTGPFIDSASVGGEVKDAQTNLPILDALVGLYRNSDTLNVEKMKPTYFTRTDSSGRFSIENVQPNQYRLIAIDDKNRSMTFNSKAERIGFLRDSIELKANTQMSGVSLKLFMANNSPQKVKTTLPRNFYYTIVYERGIQSAEVKFDNPSDSIPYFRSSPNDLKFYNTKNKKDTLLARIFVRDSAGLTFEHVQKIKFREGRGGGKNSDAANRDPFEMSPNFKDGEPIEPKFFNLILIFTKPVEEARLGQITLFSDSTKNENVQPTDLKWENNRTVLTLNRPIKATKELKLTIPKSTFFSVEGDTIPPRLYRLRIMDEENYGTIQGEVRGAKGKFIVELLNDKYEVIKSIANQTAYVFTYIKPAATYFLRVIADENSNGRWDGGDIRAKRLAEPIIYYPDPIKVKKNFILGGLDLTLP